MFFKYFKASRVWHLHVCIYLYEHIHICSLILWPVFWDWRKNSGINLDLPSCLRKALVYDHKNPRVSNISDLTSWAGWSSLEGRHSLFTAFSRLRSSRSLRESPFSCFHCFLGVLGLEILTLHVWLNVGSGIQTCGLLELVQALLFTEPGGFLLKGCVSQLALWTMEVIFVPIRGSILLSSVGKNI